MKLMALDIESYEDPDPLTMAMLEKDLRAPSNWKDPAKIMAAVAEKRAALMEKAALSPLTGQVVAIGFATRESGDWSEVDVMTAEAGGEIELLQDFALALRTEFRADEDIRFVTFGGKFGGRGFDLRFLAIRCALHGIDLTPHRLPMQDRRAHFDLCGDVLGSFQGKLQHWAQRLLGETKLGEGADVADLVLTGKWKELEDYCRRDVHLVCRLFDRLYLTAY